MENTNYENCYLIKKVTSFDQKSCAFCVKKTDQFVRLFAMDNSHLEGDVARPILHTIVVEKHVVFCRKVFYSW